MRIQTKRAFDYYLGRPVLAVLQAAAWALGRVLDRDHAVEPVRTILIVKFQGIGSLVIAKPALAALRRARPEARIIFWGTTAVRHLAEQMPEFDEVRVLDDRSVAAAVWSTLSSLWYLQRQSIDWAIDLEVYSRLSSGLVTLTCARNRTGFALDQLRSRRLHTHLVYFNRYTHLGQAYARIAGQLLPPGAIVDGSDYGGWRFAPTRLPDLPPAYFVININAGDLALERRWPRASFSALIDALLRARPDAEALLIGHGAAEVAYCAAMPKRERLRDLSGTLGLVETMRLIAHAQLVVSNDTAPLHFALGTRAPVVGLFGPTRAETYVSPGHGRVATAQLALYCSPCVHHWEPPPCGGDNQCMKRLTVASVLALCLRQLDLPMPSPPPPEPPGVADSHPDYYPGLVYERPGRRPS